MGYLVENVIKQLIYHKKIYLVFLLEIVIGVTLLVSCLNIYFSWKDELEQLKKDRDGKEMTVSYSNVDIAEDTSSVNNPITFKDYKTLSKKYKDNLELSYGCESYVSFALKSSQTFYNFTNFFMDYKMYESLFGSKMKRETVYAGTNAYEAIKKIAGKQDIDEEVIPLQEYFVINKDGSITLKGGGSFLVKPIDNKTNRKIISHPSEAAAEEDNYIVYNCVILPLEQVKDIEEQLNGWKILNIKYKPSGGEINQVPSLLTDLAKWHGSDYIYKVPDKFLNMESAIEDADVIIMRYFYASVCILIIIMIGMVGVMLIFLHQRRQTIAVKIAFGSGWKYIFTEIFLELWTVFIIGGGLGLFVSYFILPMLKGAVAGAVTFHIICIPLLFLFTILAAFMVCICSIAGMEQTPLAQILKEL